MPVKAHRLPAGVSPGRVLVGVVELEAEPPGQGQRLGVLRVDELRVLLDYLPIAEITAQRLDPPAGDGVELVDLGPDPVPAPQPVGAAESGDPRADDDHAGRVPAAG